MATLRTVRVWYREPEGGSATFEVGKYNLDTSNPSFLLINRRALDENADAGWLWLNHVIIPWSAIEKITYHYDE